MEIIDGLHDKRGDIVRLQPPREVRWESVFVVLKESRTERRRVIKQQDMTCQGDKAAGAEPDVAEVTARLTRAQNLGRVGKTTTFIHLSSRF